MNWFVSFYRIVHHRHQQHVLYLWNYLQYFTKFLLFSTCALRRKVETRITFIFTAFLSLETDRQLYILSCRGRHLNVTSEFPDQENSRKSIRKYEVQKIYREKERCRVNFRQEDNELDPQREMFQRRGKWIVWKLICYVINYTRWFKIRNNAKTFELLFVDT